MIEFVVERLMIPEGTIVVSMNKDNFDLFISRCLVQEDVIIYILRGRRYLIVENSLCMIIEESFEDDSTNDTISHN